jgi:hypothetical protein
MVQQSSSALGYGLLEATNACYREVPRFLKWFERNWNGLIEVGDCPEIDRR